MKASEMPKKPGTEKGRNAVRAAAPVLAQRPAPEKPEPMVSRRDPFSPLVAVSEVRGGSEHLPSGKAGLVIGTVHVDGTVKAPNGMIAVVSNPQDRVYFIRVGDRLYDGDVETINLDGVTFRENSKDAFGKPVERLVTKRIYPSAGEQQ
jgi:Tfp pilus assembly protein PilP